MTNHLLALSTEELDQLGRADEHGITDSLLDRALTRAQAEQQIRSHFLYHLGLHGPTEAHLQHVLDALFKG